MIDAETLRLLHLYREAQVAYWNGARADAAIDKRTIFAYLFDICLKNHVTESGPPALFMAICRGPRDEEVAGEDWTGIETPITEMDGERIKRLWNAASGRSMAR